jgi:hypothetical protein
MPPNVSGWPVCQNSSCAWISAAMARAAQVARRPLAEERLSEAAGADHEPDQPEHLEQARCQHALAEEPLGERVDEEDPGRLEVPEVAVRQLPVQDPVTDDGVDPLVAPEGEHEDLQRRERRDEQGPRAQPCIRVAHLQARHDLRGRRHRRSGHLERSVAETARTLPSRALAPQRSARAAAKIRRRCRARRQE